MNSTRREPQSSADRSVAVAAARSAIRQLHAATEVLLDAAAARYGITRNDLRCLEILEREGTMHPSRLAEASGLSRAAITKVLDRLEAADYVTRTGERSDRRAFNVQTSDHLADQRRSTWRPVVQATEEALSDLDPAQLEDLTMVLLRLADTSRTSARRLQ